MSGAVPTGRCLPAMSVGGRRRRIAATDCRPTLQRMEIALIGPYQHRCRIGGQQVVFQSDPIRAFAMERQLGHNIVGDQDALGWRAIFMACNSDPWIADPRSSGIEQRVVNDFCTSHPCDCNTMIRRDND